MLGYELPIHEIMPSDVFISICEKTKRNNNKAKLEQKKREKKEKNK